MTKQLVDKYSELDAQRTLLALDKQALIDSILTDEIKAKLAEIDAEFAPQFEAVDDNMAGLMGQIKEAVLHEGATVKGDNHMAVLVKGRTSWDNKMLDGLALVIPEVNKARKEGEPSVSIRRI